MADLEVVTCPECGEPPRASERLDLALTIKTLADYLDVNPLSARRLLYTLSEAVKDGRVAYVAALGAYLERVVPR